MNETDTFNLGNAQEAVNTNNRLSVLEEIQGEVFRMIGGTVAERGEITTEVKALISVADMLQNKIRQSS